LILQDVTKILSNNHSLINDKWNHTEQFIIVLQKNSQ